MGSFATSLHVKSTDPNRVAASLTEILTGAGWRPTPEAFPIENSWGEPSNWRALQISAARDGWVSILDSDLGGAHSLTSTLATKLATPAILFFVNDSDSWSYLLADAKGATTEFDSEEEAGDDDGDDLVDAASAFAQINSLMRDGSIMQKMQGVQSRMSAAAPPEIRAAEERIKTGRGTAADIQQYQAWAMQEMPKYMAEMRSLLGAVIPGSRTHKAAASQKKPRAKSKSEQTAWKKRLRRPAPLLAPGVTDEQLQSVLDKRAIFAEEILAEFLPLLGLSDYYANLSYRYLDESVPDELSPHNIRFLHHLRFETNSPRLFSLPK